MRHNAWSNIIFNKSAVDEMLAAISFKGDVSKIHHIVGFEIAFR